MYKTERDMSEYYCECYKYNGPTVYTHKAGNPDGLCVIYPGTQVVAEVNIQIATITKVMQDYVYCDIEPIKVAAEYLECVGQYKTASVEANGNDDYHSPFDLHFNSEWVKEHTIDVPNIEVGGDHYQTAIQPWDFIYANSLDFDAGNIVKYACRHKKKGGAEDVKKIISYAKHILKTRYGIDYIDD